MNFKEALIAHLQGEKVECRYEGDDWVRFEHEFGGVAVGRFKEYFVDYRFDFRLTARTILVNNVEVPAPEKEALEEGSEYFNPNVFMGEMLSVEEWIGSASNFRDLERGLVYLNKEDAIARAKALLTQE